MCVSHRGYKERQMRHGLCPLRSSQSIEHRQQIEYWFCLLGSTFFCSETPFYLCLAAVHIQPQMKRQASGKHALEEPRMGQRPANRLSWRGSLLMLWLSHEKEAGRSAPSELWEPGRSYSEAPSGTHQKSKNRIDDTSFHQPVLAPTAGTAARPPPQGQSSKLQPKLREAGPMPEFGFVY